jgi:hypothetical protein
MRKHMSSHYKGGFVGLLLGIAFTLLVQNVTLPASLKKAEVPPNPSAGIIPCDPPTPQLTTIPAISNVPPNNPPGMPRSYGPDGRNAPPPTELPLPTDPPKLKPPTELPGFPNGLPPNYIPPAPPRE